MFPFCASAQTASASLSGRVTDPSGAVIPNASVKVINVLTGVTTSTLSNGAGDYVFATLPPGSYRLTVSAPGFSQSVTQGIQLFVQDRIARNVSLRVGAPDQTVTVNAAAQQLDTQDATVGTVVERGYIANMPLNGRSFQGLIALAPGVGTIAPTGSSGAQFVVNGQRTDTSYFTVDGVSANVAASGAGSLGTSGPGGHPTGSATGGFNNMVSLDALEEFRITTSSFAPEFGRTPGGQISLITRSGTNSFHGDAFDYFRNTVLDANDWFLNAAGKARGVVQQNDFGGPILRAAAMEPTCATRGENFRRRKAPCRTSASADGAEPLGSSPERRMEPMPAVEFVVDGRPLRIDVRDVIVAGWTGRDIRAVEEHIAELEAIGVARPSTVPCFYRVGNNLLSTEEDLDVCGSDSSGEVEFVLVSAPEGLFVGVGSDHTDRKVEAYGVTISKKMCPKPIGRELWRFKDVTSHWDSLLLRPWITRGGARSLYQQGSVTRMRTPQNLVARYLGHEGELSAGSVLYCGTLAVPDGIASGGEAFEVELEDPLRGRTLRHRYTMRSLSFAD